MKKHPSTNLQHPEKHQSPSLNNGRDRDWNLKFGASLVLGAWNLELN
ncbi:MAG TPA: hypothetical protein PKA41_11005 [Verrucomicrobiota bacterium]|nr:hypothetical protein [Verrucomicrobiota bacterium]